MEDGIIKAKDSKKNLFPSLNKKRFKKFHQNLFKKQTETIKSLRKYYQTAKSDLDSYYKFSSHLRRRNSIESAKINKKKFNKKLNRSKTIIDPKKIVILKNLKDIGKEREITVEKMHNNLAINHPNYRNVEERIKFLTKLNPFYEEFNKYDKRSETIITAIAPSYKGKILQGNQIIFRYGEELNDFYFIHQGKVNLYCPFIESIYMNIDEYYIYLLRLRRYEEIEMLNNVLLMNNLIFMPFLEEQFNFDKFVLKLYYTLIKVKLKPGFLNTKEKSKYNFNNTSIGYGYERYNLKNDDDVNKIIADATEYHNIISKSFKDNDTKNLVMRIQDELIETMMYINPDEMKQIIDEENDKGGITKKLEKLPDYMINQYKNINPDRVRNYNNNHGYNIDYIKRICPIKIFNTKLQKQKIIIMKYVYINTLSKGEYFGETLKDSNDYFPQKILKIMNKSKLNLNVHQYEYFYNVTAITVKENYIDNNYGYIYLGYIPRIYYTQYFKKFVDKMEYAKKRFILNNRLFKNNKNENFIKTYSRCFRKRILKENECLISEKDILTEENTFLYFIVKGEFQSICNQSLEYIDHILKALNCEEKLKETIPIKLNIIKDSFFFEEICKKELKIKLSYLTQNDIIGFSEKILKDRYINSIYCLSKEALVYYVDVRIIKLLAEGDKIIKENRNFLINEKIRILIDLLLKQRKSYLDSYSSFQIDSIIEKENSMNIHVIKKANLFKEKNSFIRPLTSQSSKNNNFKNYQEIKKQHKKEKKYTSLSSVCDILGSIYRGVSYEVKRKEKSLLFRKNYELKNKNRKKNKSQNNQELDMTLDLLNEIENQKTKFICFKSNLSSIKPIERQKSSFNLKLNHNLDKSIIEKKHNEKLILKKNFFINKKENNKDNKESENSLSKNHINDVMLLNYDMLWKKNEEDKKNISMNIVRTNDYFKNIRKENEKNNLIRLNKLRKTQLYRKEMLNQKLRNIYYSDLEKILLNEHFNNYMNPK